MIDLAAPVRTFDDVTVFADHAVATLFHYVPIRPRLVLDADGHPDVRLVKYHLDPATQGVTGAGLFSLTVDLAVPDDVLTGVRDKLAAAVGRTALTLNPVWADSGRCRLILLDSSLVPAVIGGATPALASNATTLFVCTLDPAGVGIVEQALRRDGLPFGVVYELQVAGLRPALRATISADYRYAYHYYENRLHGGKLLLATDIGATVQDLVQAQAIRITVDDLVPDADHDGVYQQALDAVQQYVLQTLFTPTLDQSPPASPPSASAAGLVTGVLGLFTLSYTLTTVDTAELKTLTYQLAVARAEEITLAPQAELSALLPPGMSADSVITAVDPAPPSVLVVDIASLVDLAAEGIDRVEVTVTYAGTDTAVALTPAAPRQAVPVPYVATAGTEFGYRYDATLAAGVAKGIIGTLPGPSGRSVHDVVRIDPRELYQQVEVRPVLQGVPFDRFPRVIVDLQAHESLDGWTATDTIELDASTAESTVRYRGRRDGLIALRARVRYVGADGHELARDWDDIDAGPLVLGNPEPDIVDVAVLASARFGTAVARLVVELRPASDPGTVTTLTFDATTTAASYSYVPGADRGYQYRVTVQTVAGEVRTGDWQAGTTDPTLVVGEGYTRLRTVRVVFVGATLAEAGLLALTIRLRYADAQTGLAVDDEFLVQDPPAPISWSYPVADPARLDHTLLVTRVAADGSSSDDPPVTGSELLHVLPLIAKPA